jgi:hypothetical protein
VSFWNLVQHIDERHRIPADGARPDCTRCACARIRPELLARFIPTVVNQSGLGIAAVLEDGSVLTTDIIEDRRLVEAPPVLRVERQREPQTVQPNLMRAPREHASRSPG